MKTKYTFYLSILFSLFIILSSCSDKKEEEGIDKPIVEENENTPINRWIHEEMTEKYYWNTAVPESDKIDTGNFWTDKPEDFFYKMLYKYNTASGDRFSYLEYDGVPQFSDVQSSDNSGSNSDIGFEFQAWREDDSEYSKVIVAVTYIKKGSEVEKQGELKRGDWITKVNGTSLNRKNFASLLLSGASSMKLELLTGGEITTNATTVLYESPVHLNKIFKLDDKKIGYIVYNFFDNGKYKESFEYAQEMNGVLLTFKNQNIDELILDLRYNGGGYVSSGTYIASAIVPNRTVNTIYTQRKYNDILEKQSYYQKNKKNLFVSTVNSHTIPELGIKRLYVLTSEYTASASEQIINGLRAYMTVEVIGQTTTGKNMESMGITKKNDSSNKWELHPLTSVSYNGVVDSYEKNDYSNGFDPTIGGSTSEFLFSRDANNNIIPEPIYQLGDENEILLSIALENITGIRKRALTTTRSTSTGETLKSAGSSIERKGNNMIIELN